MSTSQPSSIGERIPTSPDLAPQGEGRVPLEIPRVAYRLWQQAGFPPGRYVEFWRKVACAHAAAHDARALARVVTEDLLLVAQASSAVTQPPGDERPSLRLADDV